MQDTAVPAVQPEEQRESEADRRETVVDRRCGMDRRQMSAEESGYTGPDAGPPTAALAWSAAAAPAAGAATIAKPPRRAR